MNCEELEQHIYLYRELSAAEQAAVDRHVETCAACLALLESVQRQHRLVREIASDRPSIKDPRQLTDAVMQAIGQDRPQGKVVFLDRAWFRYSAVAASAALIMFFLLEQPWQEPQLPQQAAATTPLRQVPTPVMDTQAFLKVQQQRRQKTESTFFTTYAECVQRGDCDRETLRLLKNNMKL
jgi:anti-sigma factor RsiW